MNRVAQRHISPTTIAPLVRSGSEDADALFRAVADDLPVMLWMTDRDGLCTFVNRKWLAFTSRTLPQELGDGWLEGVHPDDREITRTRAREAMAAQRPFTIEYRLRRADDQYRWVLAACSPRFDPRGS